VARPERAESPSGTVVAVFQKLLDRFRRRQPKQVSNKDILRISYEPRTNGKADPGEVVWTWVPYREDPNQGKDRPVLVIGTLGDRLAALTLTSKDHSDHPDCVPLGSGGWDPQRRPSYVRVDKVLRVKPDAVRREGSALDKDRFDTVVAEFRRYHQMHPR